MAPQITPNILREALEKGLDPELIQTQLDEIALIEEQTRLLEQNPILSYRPNPMQDELHRAIASSGATRFEIKSGNRGGKTRGAVNEGGAWTKGERLWYPADSPFRKTPFRPPVVVRIGSTPAELEQTIQKYVPAALLRDDVARTHRNQQGVTARWELKNGSQIISHSYKQETIEWEGAFAHLWIFNEPPPYDKYIAAVRGLADFGGYVIIAMTHLAEPWIRHKIEAKAKAGNKKYWFKQFSTAVNIGFGLSDEGAKQFAEELGGPESQEYRVRYLGDSIHAEGLVVQEFDPEVHIQEFEWDLGWGVYWHLDPHPQKPYAGAIYGINPYGQLCIIDEFWIKVPHKNDAYWRLPSTRPGLPRDVADWVIEQFEAKSNGMFIAGRYIDPIAKTPGFHAPRNSNLRDELALRGHPFGDGTKDRQTGILNIKSKFSARIMIPGKADPQPLILMRKRCLRHAEELESWMWEDAEETDPEAKMNKARAEFDDQMSNLYRFIALKPVHIPREAYEAPLRGADHF